MKLNIRLDEDLSSGLRVLAEKEERTVADAARRALRKGLGLKKAVQRRRDEVPPEFVAAFEVLWTRWNHLDSRVVTAGKGAKREGQREFQAAAGRLKTSESMLPALADAMARVAEHEARTKSAVLNGGARDVVPITQIPKWLHRESYETKHWEEALRRATEKHYGDG